MLRTAAAAAQASVAGSWMLCTALCVPPHNLRTTSRPAALVPALHVLTQPAHALQIMNNEISGATRIAIACIQETPDSDNSGHVFSGNSIVGFGLDGIQVQCDDVTVTDNMIDPGTVVNAQQARAQFVSTRSERRESGERRETPPMAPDSTAVYGIHVCGPTNFDEDGDQAICVAPRALRDFPAADLVLVGSTTTGLSPKAHQPSSA